MAGAEETQVLKDDEGDVKADTLIGVDAPAGTYESSGADLLALSIDEDDANFWFNLAVGSIAPSSETSGSAKFTIEFWHKDQSYQVVIFRGVNFDGSYNYNAFLQAFDAGRDRFVNVNQLPIEAISATESYLVTVSRDLLLDGNGTAPVAGRELRLLRVQSQGFSSIGPIVSLDLVSVSDVMPDTGTGDPYVVQRGLQQTGHAFLNSEDPVRSSNGEEATFVYYVEAHNTRSEVDRFDLESSQVPTGWDITLPAASLRIEGNSSVRFPVLVTTPFVHQHGAFENFILELTSRDNPRAVGRLELGIRYLEVPQPAGHHDTLYIHTREQTDVNAGVFCLGCPPPTRAFMNTVEDYALNEGIGAHSQNAFLGLGDWDWAVFLEPGLQMGLDFDVSETRPITLNFQVPLTVDNAVLGGSLTHYALVEDSNGASRFVRTTLANLLETPPQDFQGDVTVETTLVPTPDAEFIQYHRRAALALELHLDGTLLTVGGTEEQTQPKLTGGTLQLPLFEYRDPVDDVFSELAGLTLRHADLAEKFVNPGDSVLFNLTLSNDGAVDDVFEIRVNGTNQEWVRVLGDQRIFVGTGNERHVVIAVSPPADAPDGAVMDLVVTVASVAEPTVQGNVRVVATVDALVDRTDEAFLIQDAESRLKEQRKSPGLGGIMVLLVMANMVAAVRRRSRFAPLVE